jgi:alpha-galactosidase
MTDDLVSLRAAGCQLLLDTTGPALPRVLHWGRDLGPVEGSGPGRAALEALWQLPVARSPAS